MKTMAKNTSRAKRKSASNAPKKMGIFAVEAYYPGQEIFEFRSNLHLSRDKFGEVLGYAGRSISNWEKGSPIADHALRSFKEVRRLFRRACAIVPESEVVRWMKSPNKELGEISPLEAIRLGKLDEVLRLIILAEEGIPV